ncbi:hypothetical protein GCM10027416_03430 [Okibacterium endophyticum]
MRNDVFIRNEQSVPAYVAPPPGNPALRLIVGGMVGVFALPFGLLAIACVALAGFVFAEGHLVHGPGWEAAENTSALLLGLMAAVAWVCLLAGCYVLMARCPLAAWGRFLFAVVMLLNLVLMGVAAGFLLSGQPFLPKA